MKLFYTQYKVGEKFFASQILADDELHVKSLIEYRGIGETVVGYPGINPPLYLETTDIREISFEVLFTAWLETRLQNTDSVIAPSGWFGQWLACQLIPGEAVVSKLSSLVITINDARKRHGSPLIRNIK